jgi:hypothetical protein
MHVLAIELAVVVTIPTCSVCVSGSNLGRDIDYLDWGYPGFLSCFRQILGHYLKLRLHIVSSLLFTAIQSFEAKSYCQLSLNKL